MRITSLFAATLALIGSALISHAAVADDTTTSTKKSTDAIPSTGVDQKTDAVQSVMDESQNNREKTLQGSKSPFSLQFNLTYSGSSIIHPLAQEVPNPGHLSPPPTANLSGTFSGRYRLDQSTTVGLGGGITMYTPFQGPSNTSVANPYTDIAHVFKLGPARNRADLQFMVFTDHLNNADYGYTTAESLIDESFIETSFGLTMGLSLEYDYYTFSGKPQYQAGALNNGFLVGNSGTRMSDLGPEGGNQTQWDINVDPYFEYKLNDTFNLRSVIGFIGNNYTIDGGFWDLHWLPVYETLGLGTQVGKSVFVYTFLEGFYDNLNARNTLFGFSAIINIF